MASTVTSETLRELAGFRATKGCAISLYLALDPQTTVNPGNVQTRVNSLLDAGGRNGTLETEHLSHGERAALEQDLGRIRRFFAEDLDRGGAHGLALFVSGLDGLWRPLPLATAVEDDVRLGRSLHLAPLVPIVGRGEGALVAIVSRERGEVYRLRAGRLETVASEFDEAPGQHDQGGLSQANYQRHVDEIVGQHLKRAVDRVNRRLQSEPSTPLVLVCGDAVRSDVESRLSTQARAAIVGWTSVEAHAGPTELLAAALPLLEHARDDEERRALDRWREEAAREGRATAGWEPTLEAASDGRVELLLVHPNVNREAFECPACGRGQIGNGTCPRDGTPLERRPDGVDIAVHQTLEHGGSIRVTEAADDLLPVEGIGALLRY